MASETRNLVASCQCNRSRLTFNVPISQLPLPAMICLCEICRRTHGTLGAFIARTPSAPTPNPLELDTATKYRALPDSKTLRWFCSTCGSHLGDCDDYWCVSTACVEDGDETVFEFKHVEYVPSSVDGGLSDWLPKEMTRWEGMPHESEELHDDSWKRQASSSVTEDGVDVLHVYCHCKGVSFRITRPDWQSKAFRKDYPDKILPPEHPSQRDFNKELLNDTWWIASDRMKYVAGACFCTSCRLSTGSEIHNWAFVPSAFIFLRDGSPFRTDFGTLKSFESSPDTFRHFCGTCGATVFWQHMRERPNLIDVAVALLDAPSGSRAEEWLEWRKKEPSYAEDAVNKKLANELSEGYVAWAKSLG